MKFKYILPNIVMKTPCQCTEWQLRKIRWGPVMHNLIKYRLERKQESFACPVGVTGIKVWLKNRAAVNYQLHMSLDRPASIQRWGQSCSLKYTSIVSQPVQAEAGKIRTCSFILGGGAEVPSETFNQIQMLCVLPNRIYIPLQNLRKSNTRVQVFAISEVHWTFGPKD